MEVFSLIINRDLINTVIITENETSIGTMFISIDQNVSYIHNTVFDCCVELISFKEVHI